METDVLLTPPPDSVAGVFADRYFLKHLHAEIERIKSHNGIVLKEGKKFKRSPYDTLQDCGVMEVQYVIDEYVRIKQKNSKFPFGCRNAVLLIVAKATHEMYDTYRRINCMTEKTKS
ncbi:MAG: hypothetical protein LBD52_01935 [Prevotellaceae bacterium]|jgi:hypothetical protein|nr:hypothetical protein [Prevotellaceae bacterium]